MYRMLEGVVDSVSREETEEEREEAGDEGDEKRLNLEEGEISEDQRTTSEA